MYELEHYKSADKSREDERANGHETKGRRGQANCTVGSAGVGRSGGSSTCTSASARCAAGPGSATGSGSGSVAGTSRSRRGRSWSGNTNATGVDSRALESDTVRGCRHTRIVGHGANGTERLGWLGIGHDLTVGSIDTGEVLVLAFARLKDTILVCSRGVVGAPNAIEDMLAVLVVIRVSRVAGLETEEVGAHKANYTSQCRTIQLIKQDVLVPLDDLLEGVVVAAIAGEGIGENQATERIATLVSAVGIHLTTVIVGSDIDEVLFDMASNLKKTPD